MKQKKIKHARPIAAFTCKSEINISMLPILGQASDVRKGAASSVRS
jgi:hypothetical protein